MANASQNLYDETSQVIIPYSDLLETAVCSSHNARMELTTMLGRIIFCHPKESEPQDFHFHESLLGHFRNDKR